MTQARDQQELGAMLSALDEARAAASHGDVPVGAVVLHDGVVIARRHNERELTGDPTAHAEVLALRDAAAHLGTWRLDDVTLVVTLEPCPMCAGAVWAARVGRLVYGTPDLLAGSAGSIANVVDDERLNHQSEIRHGVLADDCAAVLRDFFEQRRT